MAEVKRRKGESFEAFLRRFNRRIQASGRLIQAKKIRFHTAKPSKARTRGSALHRARTRVHREYLLKTGQVTEEELAARGRGGRRT